AAGAGRGGVGLDAQEVEDVAVEDHLEAAGAGRRLGAQVAGEAGQGGVVEERLERIVKAGVGGVGPSGGEGAEGGGGGGGGSPAGAAPFRKALSRIAAALPVVMPLWRITCDQPGRRR